MYVMSQLQTFRVERASNMNCFNMNDEALIITI